MVFSNHKKKVLMRIGTAFLVLVFNNSLLSECYSTEVEYLSLFASKIRMFDYIKPIFGPALVKNKLECLNRCNRDPECRAADHSQNYCTNYRIDSWNFTVSNDASATTYVKIQNDQPMVKTYNYYAMVVLWEPVNSYHEFCYDDEHCFQNLGLECIELDPYNCECHNLTYTWWDHSQQMCIPRKDFKKQCDETRECLEVSGLDCDGQLGYCDCQDSWNKFWCNRTDSCDNDAVFQHYQCEWKKSIHEYCHDSDECRHQLGLRCYNENKTCDCDELDYNYWSRASVTCLPRRSHHEWCTEDVECLLLQGLVCDLQPGLCECINATHSYFSEVNQTCQDKMSWHQPCLTTYGCINVIGLECRNQTCDCVDIEDNFWCNRTDSCDNDTIPAPLACQPKKIGMEYCHDSDECRHQLNLFCDSEQNRCDCINQDINYWSYANQSCMNRRSFHEWCTRDIECLAIDKLECDLNNGNRCDCVEPDYNYFNFVNNTCQPKGSFKSECRSTYQCQSVKGLECKDYGTITIVTQEEVLVKKKLQLVNVTQVVPNMECDCFDLVNKFWCNRTDSCDNDGVPVEMACQNRKMGFEYCIEDRECLDRLGLICYADRKECDCNNLDNFYWSYENKTCMARRPHHEWCNETRECLSQNTECDLANGRCECIDPNFNYFEANNHTCQPKRTVNEECLLTYGCLTQYGLECNNQQCRCVDESRNFWCYRNDTCDNDGILDTSVCQPKKSVYQYCIEDTECLDVLGLECYSDRNKCDCSDLNYNYWSNASMKCLPKGYDNDSCIEDLECTAVRGLVCDLPTGRCICDDRHLNYFNNRNRTCERRIEINQAKCLETESCMLTNSGLECDSFQRCSCYDLLHNAWNSTINKCQYDASYQENCKNSRCSLLKKLECANSTCDCIELDYNMWNTVVKSCIPRRNNSQECSADSDCITVRGLECVNSKCQCVDIENNFWCGRYDSCDNDTVEAETMCQPKKSYMEYCEHSIECNHKLGLVCHQDRNQCDCSEWDLNYWSYENKTCMARRTIEGWCTDSRECLAIKNLECKMTEQNETSKCDCIDLHYYQEANLTCQAIGAYKGECLVDNACFVVHGLECAADNKCDCVNLENNEWSEVDYKCMYGATEGAECTDISLLQTNETTCNDYKGLECVQSQCKCKDFDNYYYDLVHQRCLPRKFFHDTCNRTIECHLNMECIDQLCQCKQTNQFNYFHSYESKTCKSCPTNFKANVEGGHPDVCYYQYENAIVGVKTYLDSAAECASLGGKLLTMRNEIEKTYIDKMLNLTGGTSVLIDATIYNSKVVHTDGLPGLDELIDYDWEGFINPGFEQLVGTHLIYNGSQYSTIHSLTENSFMCQYDEMNSAEIMSSKIEIASEDQRILSIPNAVELLNLAPDFNRYIKAKLLYKASINGFDSATFHRLCDGYANTLTVVKATTGYVFGAYASARFSSKTGFTTDPDAFLFSLINAKNESMISNSATHAQSIWSDSNKYGPTFGAGNDFKIMDNSNLNASSYCQLGATYRHPTHQAGSQEAITFMTGDVTFQAEEIEIFELLNKVSTILNHDNQKLIMDYWPDREYELLYRASIDGFTAAAFHAHCDDQSGTLAVLKSPKNYIYGAYVEARYMSNTKPARVYKDPEAVLYSLVNGDNTPTFMPIENPNDAVVTLDRWAILYGHNPFALVVTFSASSYSTLCDDFKPIEDCKVTDKDINKWLAGDKTWLETEVEVYKVKDSLLLNAYNIHKLITLLNLNNYKIKLHYRATRDGFSASAFHQKINGKVDSGITLSIIKTTSGHVFGGFTKKEWSSAGGLVLDNDCIIYSFVNNDAQPLIMHSLNSGFYDAYNYGPSYGNGDIRIYSDSNIYSNSYADLGNTYVHPTYAKGTDEARSFLGGSRYFCTVEIEVFEVILLPGYRNI